MNEILDLEKIKTAIRAFSKERDWDKFHSPKNVATALSIESSELLEMFLWTNENDSKELMNNEGKAIQIKTESTCCSSLKGKTMP
ncbi:MAG: hypothetical protein H7061_09095 [Bdellovibrionaceae bacterium]|nr:hypothetical protein [Bdellovibrio sp.]